MPIIEIKNLTKKYNGLTAVDNLSLEVKEGEIFGLLGPNGAGKTTTLMMLTTLLPPTSGTATIGGFDIVKDPGNVRRSIGIVFQDPSSDDILTGYENLKLHGMLYGVPKKLREKRIKEVLELVDLTDRKNDLVKYYSGGMRRRLEMARGLMHHPKILFLDEPTLGLDPQTREHIWKYVNELVNKEKITVIITTHYMDEADKLCDRLAIVDHGKIAALDSPEKLKMIVGGDVVVLKTANPKLEEIKKLQFVKHVKVQDGEVFLTVENASEHLPRILEAAGKVEAVEIHLPTLEDVFLHYTGKAIREGAAEGGWAERAMTYRTRK